MHRVGSALLTEKERSPDLNAFGAQCQSGIQSPGIGDAPCSNDRDVDSIYRLWDQCNQPDGGVSILLKEASPMATGFAPLHAHR